MPFAIFSFFLLLSCIHRFASATSSENGKANPVVTLDYGTFQGATSPDYNLTYFRSIPFGAPTSGRNRFRGPQPPIPINGTYDTDRSFEMCPQRTVNGSEDCLYLGIFSRPWDPSSQPLRPVLLSFYGGGFMQGSATFTIPPHGFPVLNASAANDYVVIYSNYRTNVFGFLPGQHVFDNEETDLNPGLLDQQGALIWIQKYIHHFGGDKTNVTIWGQSAGAGSVVAQTIATGNRGKALFSKAMASSPFWPKAYRYDDPEAEDLYIQVVEGVGCTSAEDQIACLKSVDVQALRNVSLGISTSRQYTTSSYAWAPVIGDEFLFMGLGDVVVEGELNAEVVLTTYNVNEGENFMPPGFQSANGSAGFNSSTASFEAWLKGFLPRFAEEELDEVKKLYPERGVAEEIVWNSTYQRSAMVYRDVVLACPAYWLSGKAEKGWLMEYTISPARHASDTIYWNTINPVQKSDPLTYEAFTGAMASFVQTGDPNAHKITNNSILGVPSIDQKKQFIISPTGLKHGPIEMLEARCEFWLSKAERVPF